MSSAATLHALVHGVVSVERLVDDTYGEPLQTALAVAALTAHVDDYHEDARATIAALARRWSDAPPGPSGRDLAAVSLIARCAAELGVPDPAVEQLARRLAQDLLAGALTLAPLHMAFVAYGWRGLPRTAWPWADLRLRLAAQRTRGLDAGLVGYTQALSAERVDAEQLVQDLLRAVAARSDLSQRCLLLWLLDRGVATVREVVGADDRGLRYLIERRGVLEARLAAEIDRDNFDHQPLDVAFDPDADDERAARHRLGAFEAALLDWVLVDRAEPGSSVSLAEAEEMFGTQVAAERERRRTADLLRAREVAAAAVLVSLSLGTTATLAVRLGGYRVGVAVGWGATLFVCGTLVAAWIRSRGPDRAPSAEVWAIIATLLPVAGYLLYDQTRATPRTDNPLEYALSLIIPALAVAAGVTAVRRTRAHTSARPSRDDRAPRSEPSGRKPAESDHTAK